jgi:putative toxin-antitoxin system antitoxin component (TIGR02293 family)
MILRGINARQVVRLVDGFVVLPRRDALQVIGIDATALRRAAKVGRSLDAGASERALHLASTTSLAWGVLGAQEAAERWLTSPQPGLNMLRPVELLCTSEGTALVRTILNRMDRVGYC